MKKLGSKNLGAHLTLQLSLGLVGPQIIENKNKVEEKTPPIPQLLLGALLETLFLMKAAMDCEDENASIQRHWKLWDTFDIC